MQSYSTTYIAVIVMILAEVLPKLGITVSSDSLTTTITTLVTLVSGVYLLYHRWVKGDVTILGVKK